MSIVECLMLVCMVYGVFSTVLGYLVRGLLKNEDGCEVVLKANRCYERRDPKGPGNESSCLWSCKGVVPLVGGASGM